MSLDGRPNEVRPLERCDTYTFILDAIESASSRGYDTYWTRYGNWWEIFPGEEKEESVAFLSLFSILYMTKDEGASEHGVFIGNC